MFGSSVIDVAASPIQAPSRSAPAAKSRATAAPARYRHLALSSAERQGYAGASRDRMMGDWNPGQLHPAALFRMDAKLLRQRTRDLLQNNPLAKSAIGAYVANVIGCGIAPKPLYADAARRKAVTDRWELWCETDADLTRDQHFHELTALFLEEILVAGGCLWRFVPLAMEQTGPARVPLAVELIPEERFADELDFAFAGRDGRPADRGNPIFQGIEYDATTGRNVAYWIRAGGAFDDQHDLRGPVRIPADQCVYGFLKHRIGMKRGFPMLATAIVWLWRHGYYTDNEMMASTIKSCFATLIKTNDDAAFPTMQDGEPTTVTDIHGNNYEKIEPAMIARLRPGDDVVGVGPNVPGSDGQAWMVMMERLIGIACDLSRFEVLRDTSESNFAAYRAGANADRKRYRRLQQFVIHRCSRPTWRQFYRVATMAGHEGFPRPSAFAANPQEHLACAWQPPGWDPVTPVDDSRANEIDVRMGVKSRAEIVAARGGDVEEVFRQIATEEALADDLQIAVSVQMPGANPADAAPGEGDRAQPPPVRKEPAARSPSPVRRS